MCLQPALIDPVFPPNTGHSLNAVTMLGQRVSKICGGIHVTLRGHLEFEAPESGIVTTELFILFQIKCISYVYAC